MKKLLFLLAILLIGSTSCIKDKKGCTLPRADNYNPQATEDDGSCLLNGVLINPGGSNGNGNGTIISGCMNPNADNYNPSATVDDGSCVISGCTNPDAANYDSTATTDDGSCVIYGCTDSTAENYNPLATDDDGSCIDVREKFVGTWDVTHDCQAPVSLAAVQEIIYDSNVRDTITIVGAFDVFGTLYDVTAYVKNKVDVVIKDDKIDLFGGVASVEYSGSGSINSTHTQIDVTIDYNTVLPFGGGPGSCSATYVKQ